MAQFKRIIGIDYGFSFPIAYFDRYRLPRDRPSFLLDFQKHWATHERNAYMDFIRDGSIGHPKPHGTIVYAYSEP